MSLCRIQQLRQHSTFDYKASCQERLFQGRRRFVLRNHTQIFCLRTRKRAHARAICTCKHALACPCRNERHVMSLPDLVLHTFSQKRKLVFLCFLRVIRQKHETPASAVQIGSCALKQMAETEAVRQSKPSDNAASPSTASLRRPVPEIFIACHPSSSAIRARFPRSVVLPEPRGPARRMRRPGAPGPSRFHRGSRLLRTPSLCGRQEDEHPSPLLEQDLPSAWRTPPLAAAAPSLQNSPDIGKRARQPRVFRAWKESSRTSRESPAGITPMPAPFSAMWARQKWHMQGSSLTERLCRSQTGSALSPIPICRRQAFMCAVSPKASFPPAVSVAR